jgi:histidinol-phosphate phosphatase family protein
MGKRPAVIFDLNGTLGEDDGDIRHLELYPCAEPALRLLAEVDRPAVILTNQADITRGGFTQQQFDTTMAMLAGQVRESGVVFPRVYCCPHTGKCGCACRKPSPGLAERAAADLGLDLSRSVVIGDSGAHDVLLARAIGAKAVLVRTGWGESSMGEFRHLWSQTHADFVADDAAQGVAWFLSQVSRDVDTDAS